MQKRRISCNYGKRNVKISKYIAVETTVNVYVSVETTSAHTDQ